MRSIYYVFPPFDAADILTGPEAAELATLPGSFMTPFAYEIISQPGVTYGWSRKTESIRFVAFTDEANEWLLSFLEEKLVPRGATYVLGRK